MSKTHKEPLKKKFAKFVRTPAIVLALGAAGAVGTTAGMYGHLDDDWDQNNSAENTMLVEAFNSRFDSIEQIAADLEQDKQKYVLSVVQKDGQKRQSERAWEQRADQLVTETTDLARALMVSNIDEEDAEIFAGKFVDAGLNDHSNIDLHTDGFSSKNEIMMKQGARPSDHDIIDALDRMERVEEGKLLSPLFGLLSGGVFAMFGALIAIPASTSRRMRRWAELPNVPKKRASQLKRN